MNIQFILSNVDEEEEQLLSIWVEMWPGYQIGSLVWLERRNLSRSSGFEAMPLRRFEVVQIEHHAGLDIDRSERISTNIHAEVYVMPKPAPATGEGSGAE